MDSSLFLFTLHSSLKLKALSETVLVAEGRSKLLVEAPRASQNLARTQCLSSPLSLYYLVASSQYQHQQMRMYNPFIVRSILSDRDAGCYLACLKDCNL